MLEDMDYGGDDVNNPENYARARDKYIVETRRNVESNLRDAGLPTQPVYIISKDALCTLVQGGKTPKDTDDEEKLINEHNTQGTI